MLDYTFIGRLCGQAYVKVINVGGENDDVDGMKFLLAGSYREFEEKIKLLLPEFLFRLSLLFKSANVLRLAKHACQYLDITRLQTEKLHKRTY